MDFELRLILSMFAIGMTAGFVIHRSGFCLAGMVRDFFIMRQTLLLKSLAVIILVSATSFELLRLTGVVQAFFYTPPSLNHLFGGILFGLGMSLAGSCVIGAVSRLGSGEISSGATVVGLLVGSALFAEFAPVSQGFHRLTMMGRSPTIPTLLGIPPLYIILPLSVLLAFYIHKWVKKRTLFTKKRVEGFIQPWVAAVVIALLGVTSTFFSGLPMGITTLYMKAAALVEKLIAPTHIAKTAYFAREASIDMPFQGGVVTFSPGPTWDTIAAIQLSLFVGILFGSMLSAVILGEFRPTLAIPRHQYGMALAGGVLMALGSRIAMGCNVWHLLGGLPVLSLSSILFFAGLFPGAYLAVRVLTPKE